MEGAQTGVEEKGMLGKYGLNEEKEDGRLKLLTAWLNHHLKCKLGHFFTLEPQMFTIKRGKTCMCGGVAADRRGLRQTAVKKEDRKRREDKRQKRILYEETPRATSCY